MKAFHTRPVQISDLTKRGSLKGAPAMKGTCNERRLSSKLEHSSNVCLFFNRHVRLMQTRRHRNLTSRQSHTVPSEQFVLRGPDGGESQEFDRESERRHAEELRRIRDVGRHNLRRARVNSDHNGPLSEDAAIG